MAFMAIVALLAILPVLLPFIYVYNMLISSSLIIDLLHN